MAETLEISLNGYTDLPAGTVANITTSLEMTEKPDLSSLNQESDGQFSFARLGPEEVDRYRALFKRVGEDWLWFSRATLPEEELRSVLSSPKTEVHVLRSNQEDVGLVELDFTTPENVELVIFGIVPEMVGSRAGRWLMSSALQTVWSREATKRFWLHTCTLDHPKALPFYMRSGFVPFKRQIEVAPDPRLSGHLRQDAAPHHPIIK